jgi:hypothetical protein
MRLAALSHRGKRIILTDSGHDVPREDPAATIGAVREVIGTMDR